MKYNVQCNREFQQGAAEQNSTVYEDVDRGGDLELSQVKDVGNLSESCISEKEKLEVKLETAVNSISEKDSGFSFWHAKSMPPHLRGKRKWECCQVWVV